MITIVGGGAAGLLIERTLQLADIPHQLITPSNSQVPPRKLLLNEQSMAFLSDLGFSIPYTSAYQQLKIIQHNTLFHINISAKDYNKPALCYSINAQDLQSELERYSSPINGKVSAHKRTTLGYKLFINENDEINTQYIIGCDGNVSEMKKLANIQSQSRPPYHILMIDADISGQSLIQRFGSHHIAAVIPSKNGKIILSSKSPLDSGSISPQSLQALFTHHCYIGEIKKISQFCIQPHLAESCFQNNILLFGNSALTIEPVAAQGLNHTIANIKKLMTLNGWEHTNIQLIMNEIQKNNQVLYQKMERVCDLSLISRLRNKALITSGVVSPLIHDCLYQFGSSYG